MATAIIFGAPGTGKTVNATTVKGKTLLLSSDNSSMVLKHFDRPDLTIKEIVAFKDFINEFEQATSKKIYDTVIVDCLTDIIDGFITECRKSGRFNDVRQAYMAVYTDIKYFVRQAAHCNTNCIFTCWEDTEELVLASGEMAVRRSPMLPAKIKQQVCGLCNVVAFVTSAEDTSKTKRWFYLLENTPTFMCKDQIACRKTCMPEDIFTPKGGKK